MFKSLQKRINALSNRADAEQFTRLFKSLWNNQCLSSAGLTGGASAAVTVAAAFHAMVGGLLQTVPSSASWTLTGPTITNTGNTCQAWLFLVDKVGTLSVMPGVPAATIAGIQLPLVPEMTIGAGTAGIALGDVPVVVGMLTINNASVGSFIPGTTLLNVASLGVVFSNTVGPFGPTAIL